MTIGRRPRHPPCARRRRKPLGIFLYVTLSSCAVAVTHVPPSERDVVLRGSTFGLGNSFTCARHLSLSDLTVRVFCWGAPPGLEHRPQRTLSCLCLFRAYRAFPRWSQGTSTHVLLVARLLRQNSLPVRAIVGELIIQVNSASPPRCRTRFRNASLFPTRRVSTLPQTQVAH